MKQTKPYLSVKDFAISGEVFGLVKDKSLDMLVTTPHPNNEDLENYYKSEDYISHTDAKRNLFEKAYHLVRQYALKRKLKLINTLISKEKNLLDVGCGTGSFLQTAKRNGWDITGIEPNAKARQIANDRTNNSVYSKEYLQNLKAKQFNIITLWHVLEHLPDIEHHKRLFNTLLKDDGYLIIAVPNYKSYDAQYYKQFWAAYDVPRHLWHFSRTSIKLLFESVGFKLVDERPLIFDAFYVSLLSEKYKTGQMNPIKGFWRGLLSNLKALTSKEYSSMIYILKKQK